MDKIARIIIHCTDTPSTMDVTCNDLVKWHVKENNWQAIGYHYFIALDGTIYLTRPEYIQGAGVSGHNAGAIQIAYAGGQRTMSNGRFIYADTRTPRQRFSMFLLLIDLLRRYWAVTEIVGHRDLYSGKVCPCFDARDEYSWLIEGYREIECPSPVIVPFARMDADWNNFEVNQ